MKPKWVKVFSELSATEVYRCFKCNEYCILSLDVDLTLKTSCQEVSMHILYCKKCASWKEFAKGEWKKLTQIEWFEFNFNPKEYQVSPVNHCVKCTEVTP